MWTFQAESQTRSHWKKKKDRKNEIKQLFSDAFKHTNVGVELSNFSPNESVHGGGREEPSPST